MYGVHTNGDGCMEVIGAASILLEVCAQIFRIVCRFWIETPTISQESLQQHPRHDITPISPPPILHLQYSLHHFNQIVNGC